MKSGKDKYSPDLSVRAFLFLLNIIMGYCSGHNKKQDFGNNRLHILKQKRGIVPRFFMLQFYFLSKGCAAGKSLQRTEPCSGCGL